VAESEKKKELFELEQAKVVIEEMKKQELVDLNVRDCLQKELEDVKRELSIEKNRRVVRSKTCQNLMIKSKP
jgi:hypothetical protein